MDSASANTSVQPAAPANSGGDSQAQKEPIATNVRGTVKWFHRIRGFGFVTRDDTKEDVFVHYSSLKPTMINLMHSKKRLNLLDKEKVQFDVIKTADGFEAVNVVGKNGYLLIDIIAYKRDIPPFNLEIINDDRVTGKVKWFNVKIKYGFIHCDFNNEDVFVHSSAIVKNNPNKYKPSLCEGEQVEFDILKTDGKLEAVNVSGPNGTPVEGSRYSPDKTAEDTADKTYTEKSIVGKVKWFNVKAGFGFINRNDNGQDVYAHYSSIVNKNPNHRVRSLADGELVQFNIILGSKGAEATDITGVNGVPVQGSEYARSKTRAPEDGEEVDSSLDQANNSASAGRPPRKANSAGPNTRPLPGPYPYNNNGGIAPPSYRGQRAPRPDVSAVPPNTMINKPINRRGIPPAADYSNPRPQNAAPSYGPYPGNYAYNKPPRGGRPYEAGDHRQPPPLHHAYQPVHQNAMRPGQQPYQQYNSYMGPNQGYDMPVQNGYYSQPQRLPPTAQPQYAPSNQMMNMSSRISGTVKWYNFKNGFGFITRNDTSEDVFVHKSGIQSLNNGLPSLDDGEPVEFDLFNDGQQILAINVTGPQGSGLRGSKYAIPPSSNMNSQPAALPTAAGAPKVYRRRKVETRD